MYFNRDFILLIGAAIALMAVVCFALGYISGRLARKKDVDSYFKKNVDQLKKLLLDAYWTGHRVGVESHIESEG